MRDLGSFQNLVAALRRGEDDAWRCVLASVNDRLMALARSRLGRKLRAKLGPEDVVQSVYRTFYRRLRVGDVRLSSWEKALRLLLVLTKRRCCRWHGYHGAQRRAAAREVPLQSGADGSTQPGSATSVADRRMGPECAAALFETLDLTFRGLTAVERATLKRGLLGEDIL